MWSTKIRYAKSCINTMLTMFLLYLLGLPPTRADMRASTRSGPTQSFADTYICGLNRIFNIPKRWLHGRFYRLMASTQNAEMLLLRTRSFT